MSAHTGTPPPPPRTATGYESHINTPKKALKRRVKNVDVLYDISWLFSTKKTQKQKTKHHEKHHETKKQKDRKREMMTLRTQEGRLLACLSQAVDAQQRSSLPPAARDKT